VRCAGELSAFERTRAAMRDLPELEPPQSLDDVLLREAAKAVRLQPEPAPSFFARLRESLRVLVLNPAMTAAVTLVVVLGISFVIYRNTPPPKSGIALEPPPSPAAISEERNVVAAAPAAAPEAARETQTLGEEGRPVEQKSGWRLSRDREQPKAARHARGDAARVAAKVAGGRSKELSPALAADPGSWRSPIVRRCGPPRVPPTPTTAWTSPRSPRTMA